ncbi:ABC transporter substrate-binding protein [Chelatococcus reniformis]|uniref:Branched-chain amino acid ABC transporter substrate-binding protein n=1 Tax=Chelatococcus reniformis TaxID=1494448 RepID=A0A916XNF2_9HYPH|nr:ABC transporter substrate-binding protein [Chelatococcus reniformis]GGC89156.1 branched-chain amino acid ABC transporter substrate-binding protein [Chelatococcus reniformis]
MKRLYRAAGACAAATIVLSAVASPASAEKAAGPGVSDSEIKIGNTMPYSGPASSLGAVGRVAGAYFRMINEQGGINGRKLTLLSLDDGFAPPKTVEQTRKLVESDGVAFMFATMGTAPSSAIAKYLNGAKVPQIFLISSASKWNDPKNQPWSIAFPWQPPYANEAAIYLSYIRKQKPDARIALLYQNDDAGKEYLKGTRDALGADADKVIAAALPFEVADPTVDSQILALAATKADALMIYGVTPRACSQAIRKTAEIGWTAVRFLAGGCANPETVLKPAGLENAAGLISVIAFKPITAGPQTDPAIIAYLDFMKKYSPELDPLNSNGSYAYTIAGALTKVLQQAGSDLTRENIMRQAANLKDVELPLLLPGIRLNTSPDDFRPLRDGYLAQFKGGEWVAFGDLIKGQ